MTDPGLQFWLSHVEAEGGLWEPVNGGMLVVLPRELSLRYRLAEELVVTDDPDVARSDGAAFIATGHPALIDAAEAVLANGDAGSAQLDATPRPALTQELLQDRARAQLPVNHGRIDAAGKPAPVTHWVVQVGALATYTISAEDHFQEKIERWVHAGSRRQVPDTVVDRLTTAALADDPPKEQIADEELLHALAEADRLIEADVAIRRTELARQFGGAHEEEQRRATAYYADVMAGIERRLTTAPADRRDLLEARLTATREEQGRRLAEITEKYQASHEIRPYRLRVLAVPALRLAVDVRRGDRRYPMELDWLIPAGVFAEPRCPTCGSAAPLVAGKTNLGCLMCSIAKSSPPPASPPAVPSPRPKPVHDPPAPLARKAAPLPKKSTPRERPVAAKAQPLGEKSAAVKAQRPREKPAAVKASPRTAKASPAVVRAHSPAAMAPPRFEKLVASVWESAAEGRTRGLRNVFRNDSPAAALHHVYGADGPLLAIGSPPRPALVGFSADSTRMAHDWGLATGYVITEHTRYPYSMRWHETPSGVTVSEILPFSTLADRRFNLLYWLGNGLLDEVPLPTKPVDDVSSMLIEFGIPWHGFAVTARALAAWFRVRELQQPFLLHQPAVVAAAIHRLIASRAGAKGRFSDAAEGYGTDEATLRRVDAQLRKSVGLTPDRAW
ncbi:MAG: hypothetical protein QOE61_1247 [Micromonosporaceae bacterium]|nr:hypothetical protein [Micromonosporaceae bacterium]